MGTWGSREVQTQTLDVTFPIAKLFANFSCLGFIFGLLIHEREVSIYQSYIEGGISLTRYLSLTYFGWYLLTWYIVYVGIYIVVIEAILRPFLFAMVGYKREMQCEILLEIMFGLWTCGSIIGSWIDWEKDGDCLKTGNCESYFMQNILYTMESLCEYFAGYDYDPIKKVYFLKKDNICYRSFHYCPTFLMTLLSTSLSYMMLQIIQ